MLPKQLLEITSVRVLAEHPRPIGQLLAGNPALRIGDLIGAAGLQALMLFKRTDEITGVEQACMRAGVKPGKTAPHQADLQGSIRQIAFEQRGDLQFAARRWLDLRRALRSRTVKEIEPSHSKIRCWGRKSMNFLGQGATPQIVGRLI